MNKFREKWKRVDLTFKNFFPKIIMLFLQINSNKIES